MKLLLVAGTRPNFMKIAPLYRAFGGYRHVQPIIVHTGQHFDDNMSQVFFEQLELPESDHYLGIHKGSNTSQTARIMLALEDVIHKEKPDLVIVVGDVNSTLACALAAVKSGIQVAHVEAGLRSGDRTMPEEINRILTDKLSDYLFVTEHAGLVNLLKEGIAIEKIHLVGNVMIDTLVHFRKKTKALDLKSIFRNPINSTANSQQPMANGYCLTTMHRPSNVDNEDGLKKILRLFRGITQQIPLVFPIHPRTRRNFESAGLFQELASIPGLLLLEPQGYLQFLKLMENARLVITDSGGIQEETTFLRVPCITFRERTERPITIQIGTNILVKQLKSEKVLQLVQDILNCPPSGGNIPYYWDGKASERIAKILLEN